MIQIMGIQCDCSAFIHGDNQSILANTNMPHSMLKRNSKSIVYHFVGEVTARDEWRAIYINTNDNRSDLLTKPFLHGDKTGPVGSNHGNLGPCPRPWHGVVADPSRHCYLPR